MSADLMPFDNGEYRLDIQLHEVDGLHVLAPGLARALGFREAYDLLRSIPQQEKGSELVRTPGGPQQIGYLTEAGFYRALGQRQVARIVDDELRMSVARFQSWVYSEVLPQIRKTGGYGQQVDRLTPLEYARKLVAAEERAEMESTRADLAESKVAELEPKAGKFDSFLSADGDYDVNETAKVLQRAGINTGEKRLFGAMQLTLRWIYRDHRNRPRAYQSALDAGYLREKPQGQYLDDEGRTVLRTPQVRVTPKGIDKLIEKMRGAA